MGTSWLCSTTLCRYPQWMVSYGYTSHYSHNSPKRLQITATTTITEKQTRVSATTKARKPIITAAILAAAAAVIVAVNGADTVAVAAAAKSETQQEIIGEETFSNVPQTLSGGCSDGQKECNKARIQRPKSRQAETCTVKCVNTCIRGGSGSPGEGPLNVRRPLVVFKQGFHSRKYCLVECSDICNLIKDGEDGP